jgi:nitronate monooxygenase/enoyl-[acyl-carrier protein] reductase II
MRTRLCDVLGIEVPIIAAPFGPWDSVELAAAVCRAGALGSLGTAVRPVPELRGQWRRLRSRTDRPFAINHVTRPFDEEAFAATLAAKPAAISFHLGDPGELVARAHDAGIRWIQQVMDVEQAREAVRRGVDVIVAQGGEAGGHSGFVGTMALVPQFVDIAGAVPVVAAGGIADGRGLAAALALGAAGVAMGTRFLASDEMSVDPEWKRMIVRAAATDAVRADVLDVLLPAVQPAALSGRRTRAAHALPGRMGRPSGRAGPTRPRAGRPDRRGGAPGRRPGARPVRRPVGRPRLRGPAGGPDRRPDRARRRAHPRVARIRRPDGSAGQPGEVGVDRSVEVGDQDEIADRGMTARPPCSKPYRAATTRPGSATTAS